MKLHRTHRYQSSASHTAAHYATAEPNTQADRGPDLKQALRRLRTTSTRGRRYLLTALLLLLTPLAHTQTQSSPELDPGLGITTIPLYAGAVPDAKGTTEADIPTLTVFRPIHSNGTAVIVTPGGAYIHLASNHEGRQEADRLAEFGVTTFVLKYRLGPTYLYPVPLEDARRAVRLVRSLAPKYGYSPDRIGMMGFSAGGHLTAMTGTTPEDGHPNDPDPVEHESSKLNFLVLIYPWLNAMQPQVPDPSNGGKLMINYCSVTKGLTQADCAKLDAQYTPLNHVSSSTPPTFMALTEDDKTVPSATSVDFYNAMHKADVECELHIFGHGPHGFGTGSESATLGAWQDLLIDWLRSHNWLTPLAANTTSR